MRKYFINTLLAALLGFSLTPLAFAAGAVEVKSTAEIEIKKTNKEGKVEITRGKVKSAPPGSEIIYTTSFKNMINKPVGNIGISNPIPNDTTYKAGSAEGTNTSITYSVDGGKTYDVPENLKAKDKEGKDRSALPAEYTHIRWVYKAELAAGKTSDVSFRAVIK